MNSLPKEKGLMPRAIASALGLGAWFFLAYGFCNWWTSRRPDVGTLFWDWERHIPFVPAFIVPYMSIDLFFAGAFFLCRSRQELRILNLRLFADIALSATLFLLFPLQLGVTRPTPEGWSAPIFAFLHAGDLPYNLAPSLHISLRSLLWITYGKHLRGVWRQITKFWFMLVGISTLLTWQHHLFDVAAGFVMAWFIMVMIPDRAVQPGPMGWLGVGSPRHRALAQRYGVGALVCAALILLPKIGPLFAWPAVGLGITTLAYATANPRFLQKSSGTLSPAAEWILLPIQVGRTFVQRRWSRQKPAWNEVAPNVWLGRMPKAKDAEQLIRESCVACVDLTAESNFPAALRERIAYLNVPTLDLMMPDPAHLPAVMAFIAEHQRRGVVLIHCQLGLGRSALVSAAWLLHYGTAPTPEMAMDQVARARPSVVFSSNASEWLAQAIAISGRFSKEDYERGSFVHHAANPERKTTGARP